ncbi:anti-sigma factor [Sphingopyxis sp. KK2]|uniref:anti-sigma factor family protein n=1 Tax=Sphingopyxis sp. KK2 TaxID=1855727 RepID=UPI00097E6AB1|nr:NepR family anti-sigma factor [Sphingopyxis sp. KK2]
MSFDKATIAAFVDGELDDLTARRIEREAQTDAALAAEIARHRALTDRLHRHYGPVVDETIPDTFLKLLAKTETPAADTSLAARREAKRTRFAPAHWGAIAASLILGLTLGTQPWRAPADVATESGVLVASGALATALDTQLASNQRADAPIRIGLTFRDRTGRACRSFESAALAGIGCRAADEWMLERTMPGSRQGDYRQAGSGELAAAASAMMAGDAFDDVAESKARAAGWR